MITPAGSRGPADDELWLVAVVTGTWTPVDPPPVPEVSVWAEGAWRPAARAEWPTEVAAATKIHCAGASVVFTTTEVDAMVAFAPRPRPRHRRLIAAARHR